MATLETPIGAQALVALSRLLLLLTFDEDRLDPLLSDKGAAASYVVSVVFLRGS